MALSLQDIPANNAGKAANANIFLLDGLEGSASGECLSDLAENSDTKITVTETNNDISRLFVTR